MHRLSTYQRNGLFWTAAFDVLELVAGGERLVVLAGAACLSRPLRNTARAHPEACPDVLSSEKLGFEELLLSHPITTREIEDKDVKRTATRHC